MRDYLHTLQTRWTDELGQIPTPALLTGWAQIRDAIERATSDNKWQVIQLPPGTGKTQALCTFCAEAGAGFDHPGALIVTRFKTEADKIAATINEIAGQTIALASHQDTPHSGSAIISSPVLVITHAAYIAALREPASPRGVDVLDLYQSYHHTFRKWVFVDEALQWTDTYEADLAEVLSMCGALTEVLPTEVRSVMRELEYLANRIFTQHSIDRNDKPLSDELFRLLRNIEFTWLANSITDLSSVDTDVWSTLGLTPNTFRRLYLNLINSLSEISRVGHAWVSVRGKRLSLRSSPAVAGTGRNGGRDTRCNRRCGPRLRRTGRQSSHLA